MLVSILLFAVGLVLLIKGGDWFVDGATGLAKRFKLPDIVVGATVVSIGTTLPEVMVSIAQPSESTQMRKSLFFSKFSNSIGVSLYLEIISIIVYLFFCQYNTNDFCNIPYNL